MSRHRIVGGLVVVALAGVIARGFWGFSYDDNFITYRYAWNLLAGHGLVFNPGERVLGTTAPGYALLLAGLAWLTRPLGVDIPHWGNLVALASILVVARLLASAPTGEGREPSLALPIGFAALALTSHLNIYLIGGEAFPVLALVALSAHLLFVGERGAAAGLAIGAAMCLRLDAGLAALTLGLAAWAKQRRFPAAFALSGLAVLAACLVALAHYYGHFVPNTLGGKRALLDVPYSLRQWQTLTTVLPLASAVALLAGAGAGLAQLVRRGWWRHPAVLAPGLWVLSHEVAYRLIGVWFAPWYHLYLWHAILALFVVAVTAMARWTGAIFGAVAGRVALAGMLAVVLVPSVGFVIESWGEPPDPRFRLYREAAEHARNQARPGDEILAMEIGVFGYYCERPILDLGALVSPRFTTAKFARQRPRLVAELQPAFILAGFQDPLMKRVLEHPGTRSRYVEIARFTNAAGADVRLLQRRAEAP